MNFVDTKKVIYALAFITFAMNVISMIPQQQAPQLPGFSVANLATNLSNPTFLSAYLHEPIEYDDRDFARDYTIDYPVQTPQGTLLHYQVRVLRYQDYYSAAPTYDVYLNRPGMQEIRLPLGFRASRNLYKFLEQRYKEQQNRSLKGQL